MRDFKRPINLAQESLSEAHVARIQADLQSMIDHLETAKQTIEVILSYAYEKQRKVSKR